MALLCILFFMALLCILFLMALLCILFFMALLCILFFMAVLCILFLVLSLFNTIKYHVYGFQVYLKICLCKNLCHIKYNQLICIANQLTGFCWISLLTETIFEKAGPTGTCDN